MLQRIRANWKIISGVPPATTGPAVGDADDAQYRLELVDMEPCGTQCGCPDAEWCAGAGAAKLRAVPDLDAAVAGTEDRENPGTAVPDDSYAQMSDAGMSTVE